MSEYIDTASFEPDLHWNYTVRDMMRRGEVSLLFGPSNVGKSALAGLLASCVAAGAPFCGRPTHRGLVVHVAAEAPASIAERSLAYRDICIPGEAAPYVVRSRAVNLGELEAVTTFAHELRHLSRHSGEDVALILIDTLVLSIGDLDENSTSDMTVVTEAAKRLAREFSAHVCIIHHSGKDGERGARGTSAIRSAVDTEFELRPSGDGTTLARNIKQRNLPKTSDIGFKIAPFALGEDEDGRPRTTARAVPAEAPCVSGKTRGETETFDRRTAVLTVLHTLRMQQKRAFTTAEAVAALPPQALAGVNSKEGQRKAVARILTKLAEGPSPTIRETGSGSWTWA